MSSTGAIKRLADKAGIFLDFDGTLSQIVEMPSDARPLDGVPEALRSLARIFREVSIVSGRSTHQLVEWLGPDLDIWGVHGAERSPAGSTEVILSPEAARFADLMSEVGTEAELEVQAMDIPGVVVEDKAVMVVLHYRAAPDRDGARAALEELATSLAERFGLWRGHGKLALELRPPLELSKGQVVKTVSEEQGLEAAVFCGDDVVDVPGFDALDDLESRGVAVLRVAVDSDEAPPELIERADLVVDGPAGALRFLESLL